MRIHHATLAKAKKFSIALQVEDNEVVAVAKDGTRLASGLSGSKVLEEAITKQTGHPAKKAVAKKAKKVTAADLGEFEDDEEDQDGDEETGDESDALADAGDEIAQEDEESDADQSKSGVKQKYKQLYKPTKGRCGDELGEQITAHVLDQDGKVSLTKLRRFAKANDCWVEAYASIPSRSGAWNGGMARMNVANRLRAKLRHAKKDGEVFEIKWV